MYIYTHPLPFPLFGFAVEAVSNFISPLTLVQELTKCPLWLEVSENYADFLFFTLVEYFGDNNLVCASTPLPPSLYRTHYTQGTVCPTSGKLLQVPTHIAHLFFLGCVI